MKMLPSALAELAHRLERLPGVGPKGAMRMGMYLLTVPRNFVDEMAAALVRVRDEVRFCEDCFGLSEKEKCPICADSGRDERLICVVEKAIDMLAMEEVGGFGGKYHVLGGALNPLERVGPDELKIEELLVKLRKVLDKEGKVEIVLAMSMTMEGEATALYISKLVKELGGGERVVITRLGSGLPIGADLEYADVATLSRAMDGRRAM